MLAVSDSFQLSYESSLHVTWSVVARGLRCADHRDNAATTGPEEAGTDWEPYRFGHSHGPLAFLRQVLSLLCFWLDTPLYACFGDSEPKGTSQHFAGSSINA